MTTPAKLPIKAVFYFRTLDRWPGGNADMLTVKVTMRLVPGAELEAQFYSCFDGRHAWYPPRRVAIDPGDAFAAFLDVTRSLAARGSQTLVVSPFDPGDDEWDSEWGDTEIDLFATDDGPETPDDALLRLVRRPTKVKAKASASDRELERAFALAGRLTGVSRVFEFANTQDALSAAYRAQGEQGRKDLDYAHEGTPTFLPPETDAAFVELQAHATQRRAAERAAKQAAAPAARAPRVLERETILVYRLDEVPEILTREIAPDSSVRRCLFFAADGHSQVIDAMLEEVAELEHDDTDAAMEVSARIAAILMRSEDYAWLGGVRGPDGVNSGFHGGDADAVERWLDTQDVERVSPQISLDRLILLRIVGEDGSPVMQVDTLVGGSTVRSEESLEDGLFVLDRDHDRFKLARVQDEEPGPDDACWLELRASDFPPGEIHTVTLSEPPESTKAPAKQDKSKQSSSKKAPAKQAPAKQTPAKKATATKAPAKKAASTTASAKKTSAKKTTAKKTASKRARSR